jgi:outer membrane protein insertion porin family
VFDHEGALDTALLKTEMGLNLYGRYSEFQRDADLGALRQLLVRQGYLDAQVYVRDERRDDNDRVTLTIRLVPGEKTEILFAPVSPPESALRSTSVFVEGNVADFFLEETVLQLTEHYQRSGHYWAAVTFDRLSQANVPDRITFTVEPGPKLSLEEIQFEGNQFVSDEALEGLLSVSTSRTFSRGRFTSRLAEEDAARIRSFFEDNGFLDANVSYELSRSAGSQAGLLFRITEGPRYLVDRLEIDGNEALADELLLSELDSQLGGPFSPFFMARDRTAIISAYENRGFRQVEFFSRIEYLQDQQVAVSYTVEEGEPSFVDQVIVVGNAKTKGRIVRKQIDLQPGDPASLSQILKTESNLYNLSVFSRVLISESPSFSDPNTRTVLVELEEAKRFTLLYGFGYSSFEGLRGTFGVTDSNPAGRARPLSFNLRASTIRQRGNLSYSLPRFLDGRLPTILSLTADNQFAKTGSTNEGGTAIRGRPFDSFRFIASSQSEKKLSFRESLFFRYEFEKVVSEAPPGLALEFFRTDERIRLSSVSTSYINESRDNPADPQGGFLLSGDVKVSNRVLGSQAELFRTYLQGQYYKELWPRFVWVSSMRLGVVRGYGRTDEVPISELYFSGGATTLRGLPHDLAGPLLKDEETGEVILVDEDGFRDPNGRPVPVGGEGLLIFNTELRFPIWSLVRGAFFYDLGNVFETLEQIPKTKLSNAFGLGLHVRTPVGPMRFDVAYNPKPPNVKGFRHWNFHFTLGHPF